MTVPAVQFTDVAHSYSRHAVLRGIDLSIVTGECFGLVGVNGAGKTSLLKCLFDFCAIDAGAIHIFGQSHRWPASRRPLAFLPERFTPPYYLTGKDCLTYLLKLQSLPYRGEAARAMLAALDLEADALTRTVRQYSKGMTQKLGLAACFLAEKQAYIFDEPMSGLDPRARALLKQQLRRVRETGATVFFTSHALADVEDMCDRMAILHDGKIRYLGTPQQCRDGHAGASLEQAFLQHIQ